MSFILDKYQEQGVAHLLSGGHKYLADEPGLGKTVQTIAAIQQLPADSSVVIVCPGNTRTNWYKHLEMQGVQQKIQVLERRKQVNYGGFRFHPGVVYIMSYSLAALEGPTLQRMDIGADVWVFDEAHELKNPKAKRTKYLLSPKNGIAKNAKYVWFLSATPIPRYNNDLFIPLKVALPERLRELGVHTYAKFTSKTCQYRRDPFTSQVMVLGNRECSSFLKPLLKGFLLRRTKAEVAMDLPPKRYGVFWLNHTADSQELVRQELEHVHAHLGPEYKPDQVEGLPFEQFSTLRRELAEAKIDQVLPLIDQRLQEHNKIVIMAHHVSVQRAIYDHLKSNRVKHVWYKAGLSLDKQKEAEATFREDPECKMFLGSAGASGVGLNLQVASYMMLTEAVWTPKDLEQIGDRIHRRGQSQPCLIEFLLYNDSLESYMVNKAMLRYKQSREILEG